LTNLVSKNDTSTLCGRTPFFEHKVFCGRFPNPTFFVDDGYSGTTFDRPGFQKMLDEIESGNVAVCITKDYCAIIGLNQKDLENQGILA
jgi:hypothetical protein